MARWPSFTKAGGRADRGSGPGRSGDRFFRRRGGRDGIRRRPRRRCKNHREIRTHIDDQRRGEALREGLRLTIVGPPNAGKSSLINALARRDVAIVSEIPGTTRDVIELRLDLGGYLVHVADTAGLRETGDAIEAEGVRRALAQARASDLILLLLDGSCSVHGS